MKNKKELTWKKLMLFAILAGVYTAIMALIPTFKNTSFADITISFEVWILFGIFIILKSKSPKDSALKCFVFFLISQPLVYLLQVPFSSMGWSIFIYYKYWFIWTIFTIPMGFLGYYIKKDNFVSLIILFPILLFLGYHYYGFIRETIYFFPYHLLSMLFCITTLILYPLIIFKNKCIKVTGVTLSSIIIILFGILALNNKIIYNTELLVSDSASDLIFDDNNKVYFIDSKFGNVYIKYDEDIDDYLVKAEFKRGGKTQLVLEDTNQNKRYFDLDISSNTYTIKEIIK